MVFFLSSDFSLSSDFPSLDKFRKEFPLIYPVTESHGIGAQTLKLIKMNIKNIIILPLLLITFSSIAQSAQIAGTVLNPLGDGIAEVTVELVAAIGSVQSTTLTDTTGAYSFDAPTGQTYSVRMSRQDDPLNGVSTFDLVIGMQHILRVRSIDSPYNFMAGDVNHSGSVSVRDLWEMRQMILGLQTNWERSDWIFVPADFDFGTSIEIQAPTNLQQFELTGDQLNLDFIGVKRGDISGNARNN